MIAEAVEHAAALNRTDDDSGPLSPDRSKRIRRISGNWTQLPIRRGGDVRRWVSIRSPWMKRAGRWMYFGGTACNREAESLAAAMKVPQPPVPPPPTPPKMVDDSPDGIGNRCRRRMKMFMLPRGDEETMELCRRPKEFPWQAAPSTANGNSVPKRCNCPAPAATRRWNARRCRFRLGYPTRARRRRDVRIASR